MDWINMDFGAPMVLILFPLPSITTEILSLTTERTRRDRC